MGFDKKTCEEKIHHDYHRNEWMTDSKIQRKESTIWQRRFWEHQIRDSEDFHRHLNYLHYNPVKHGYVANVSNWPYSTFHRYAREGVYPLEWSTHIFGQFDDNLAAGEYD